MLPSGVVHDNDAGHEKKRSILWKLSAGFLKAQVVGAQEKKK